MNICYIVNHPGSGGSERYLLNLSKKAKKSGNNVHYIFGEDGPLISEVKKIGIKYEIIKMPNLWSVSSAMKIRNFICNNDIEIIHSNFLREQTLTVIAKICGSKAKVVRTIHRADRFSSSVYGFMKILNVFTDKIIVPAKFLEKEIRSKGIKRTTQIPNGVETVKVNKHDKNIGYLGRIHEEKGIVDLINSLSDSTLVIAGDGPDINKINSNQVKLMGRLEDKDLEKFFSKISILVNPSPTEVMPLTYLEAFSCGVPVVCFDIPANREIINSNNGIIVKNGDYKKLLEEAEGLLRKTEKLDKLSKSVQEEYNNKYTLDIMWRKTKDIYDSLV